MAKASPPTVVVPARNVSDRQQEPDALKSDEETDPSFSTSHQCNKHCTPSEPSTGQMTPLFLGAGAGDGSVGLSKVSATFLPATWLWSLGKMSGTPCANCAPGMTPHRKTGMHKTARRATPWRTLQIKSTRLESLRCVDVWTRFGPVASAASSAPIGTTARPRAGTAEMSMTCRLTLALAFCLSRSRITMSGGRNMRARTYRAITDIPMNMPNSRSGCRALARLAKNPSDVVMEVARQLLPALTKVHARRFSARSRWEDWSQKSVKTNTTSTSMTVTRKRDRKQAIVSSFSGVST
mmetsp:Transcript_12514/g.33040  ORF Transcript_12514/g.33040 Transcript_12514/m.33040 type:complete len:295 (-) Transcript_12514:243-1127(-)